MGTTFKNSSYLSLLSWAESLTIKLKVRRSRAHKSESVFAVIVAARGALYNKASSPNASPGLYSLRKVGSVLPFYTNMISDKCVCVTYKDFAAVEGSLLHHIKVVTVITLLNDNFTSFLGDWVHGSEDNLELSWIQSVEHESLIESLLQSLLNLVALLVDGGFKIFFFIPVAEHLSTHWNSRSTIRWGLRNGLGNKISDLFIFFLILRWNFWTFSSWLGAMLWAIFASA